MIIHVLSFKTIIKEKFSYTVKSFIFVDLNFRGFVLKNEFVDIYFRCFLMRIQIKDCVIKWFSGVKLY